MEGKKSRRGKIRRVEGIAGKEHTLQDWSRNVREYWGNHVGLDGS